MRVRISPFCISTMVRPCSCSWLCVSRGEVLEQGLDAGHVVGGFGQRARELLDRGITIQFQRIEVGTRTGLGLVPVQDLRLGFDFQLGQLLLQARHRARQLGEVELGGGQLLLDARTRDAHLAGLVQQLVQQFGIDARHLGALRRRRRLAARRHGRGGHQPRECGGRAAAARCRRQLRRRRAAAHFETGNGPLAASRCGSSMTLEAAAALAVAAPASERPVPRRPARPRSAVLRSYSVHPAAIGWQLALSCRPVHAPATAGRMPRVHRTGLQPAGRACGQFIQRTLQRFARQRGWAARCPARCR